MEYIPRLIEKEIKHTLQRGKSILLLGARQTGKTTLIKHQLKPDLFISFADLDTQFAYQKNPAILAQAVNAIRISTKKEQPLIVIDEVQKISKVLDGVQYLIDNKQAQFVLTGSSARKLKRDHDVNLLPGRVVRMQLDALCLEEIPQYLRNTESLLLFGSLPEIVLKNSQADKETDLKSYVQAYLQEEIRSEAIVRNLGSFAKFLECAAIEAGNPINFSGLSQELGVSRVTIYDYFQILEDCLIVDRIEPLTKSNSRKRLSKAPKFLFFDQGIRRICANLGTQLTPKIWGMLFEHFIGIELLRWLRVHNKSWHLHYWRDHNGPEVDYVINAQQAYIPIEVKWTSQPSVADCRHLERFMDEYTCTPYAYVICQAPRKLLLTPRVMALPWQDLPEVFSACE